MMVTRAPDDARAVAVARPIPLFPPVTMTLRSWMVQLTTGERTGVGVSPGSVPSHAVLIRLTALSSYDSTMQGPQSGILVVEDDASVRDALERALAFEGYAVVTATDGAVGLTSLRSSDIDLVILDVMMPHLDGIETCRRIRASGDRVPILMLTAKVAVGDRVDGLDADADDYMTKPFALDELLARVRALLRRSTGDVSTVLRFEDVVVDPAARTAVRGDRDLELTKTEFDLLLLLIRSREIVIDRDTIYEEIWGIDFMTSSNSLDVYIGYLRRKTEAAGEPRIVHTVRGVGYVMRAGT